MHILTDIACLHYNFNIAEKFFLIKLYVILSEVFFYDIFRNTFEHLFSFLEKKLDNISQIL